MELTEILEELRLRPSEEGAWVWGLLIARATQNGQKIVIYEPHSTHGVLERVRDFLNLSNKITPDPPRGRILSISRVKMDSIATELGLRSANRSRSFPTHLTTPALVPFISGWLQGAANFWWKEHQQRWAIEINTPDETDITQIEIILKKTGLKISFEQEANTTCWISTDDSDIKGLASLANQTGLLVGEKRTQAALIANGGTPWVQH